MEGTCYITMDMLIVVLVCLALTEGVRSFVGYNVSQSSELTPQNGAHNAIDDDMTFCAITKKGVGEYWKIQFNQSVTVAGVSLRLKGGNYAIQVQNHSSEYSSQHVCSDVRPPLTFLIYNQTVTCDRPLYGDVIIINRTSDGVLQLCEFKLKVCEVNTLGIPCTKCTPESTCQSCDGSHYGVWCEHECSPGCVPGSCDELDGTCECQDGYRGSKCQITGKCSSLCENCSFSCTECDVINQNCTVCRESRFGEICQLDCPQHCEMCDINNGTCLQCETGHIGENCTALLPGVVLCSVDADGDNKVPVILSNHDQSSVNLPPEITPGGLSRERHEYLYRHIRPHVRERFRDTTCPDSHGE